MNSKAIAAAFFLALNLALHILRRLWGLVAPGPGGYDRFRENFSDEGVFALLPEERRDYRGFSRCINCGVCLFATDKPGEDPRLIAVSHSRDLGALLHARRNLPDPRNAAASVKMCPTRVPLGGIVDFIGRER